jgi:hypothetical protein
MVSNAGAPEFGPATTNTAREAATPVRKPDRFY